MTAACRATRTSDLADHQRGRFSDLDEEFPVTSGRTYEVVGVGVWETTLEVLIRDDDGQPSWCPAGLFDISDQPMPDGWRFALRDGVSLSGRDLWTQWVVVCGYSTLVTDPTHSDRLMERDPAALRTFYELFASSTAP